MFTHMKTVVSAVIFFGLAHSVVTQTAQASEKDAEYRGAVMEAIGGHMGAIVRIVKGEVSHRDHLVMHAEGLARLSEITDSLFPEGSEAPDSDALPKIWEDPEAFKERVEAFQAAAPAFSAAVAGGDMARIGPALGKLGKSCKGCHDNFRKE